MGQGTKTGRVRKTVELTAEELKVFTQIVKNFPTKLDAVEGLGFKNEGTLNRILGMGKGSQKYIELIRAKLTA